MTVAITQKVASSGTGGATWVRISGTIAEVLQELANQGFTARYVKYYSDDGTDAKAVACRRE